MASYYVYSGAAGAGTGADWANAYTTLQAAFTARAAGDTFYVAHDHNEAIAAATTLTGKGTAAAPSYVICVDRAGSVPPVSADLRNTAVYSTTGANALTLDLLVSYNYGITFSAGTGAVNSALTISRGGPNKTVFEQCVLKKAGTTANSFAIAVSGGGSNNYQVKLINCSFYFGATGDGINGSLPSNLEIIGGTALATGSSVPTTMFAPGTQLQSMIIRGMDFSANAIGTLIGATSGRPQIQLIGCKRHASTTVATTPTGNAAVIDVIDVASSGINYIQERYTYQCTQTIETTIVRTGGATDGTTAIAWKFVPTTNNEIPLPYEAPPITIWNDSTSSITVTLYGIWSGGAVPTNTDIWFDVSYLGDASSPLFTELSTGRADVLAAASNWASDTSTWGGSTTKFKMSATFTPGQKGPLSLTIKLGAASGTFYVDPKPEISGVTVSKSYALPQGAYVNELSSGGTGTTIAGTPMLRGMVG